MKHTLSRLAGLWHLTLGLFGVAGVTALSCVHSPVHAAPSPSTQLKARDAANALTKGEARKAVELYTQALADTEISNDRRATLL